MLNVENVRRVARDRIETHVVSLPPEVPISGQEIMHPVRRPSRDAHHVRRYPQCPRVRRKRIEVDRDDHAVCSILRPLYERDQVVAVDVQKTQVRELLERGVLAACTIDGSDEVLDVSGTAPVPCLDLVFLRVEVFLSPFDGRVLTQFESAVDAVRRRQRGGKGQSRREGGPAAVLENRGKDVRRIDEEVRPEGTAPMWCA